MWECGDWQRRKSQRACGGQEEAVNGFEFDVTGGKLTKRSLKSHSCMLIGFGNLIYWKFVRE